jgi:hypothetical protein
MATIQASHIMSTEPSHVRTRFDALHDHGSCDVVSASYGYFLRLKNLCDKQQTPETLTNLLCLAGTRGACVGFSVTRGQLHDGGVRTHPLAW